MDYAIFGVLAIAALHLESIALCAAALVLIIVGNLMLLNSMIRCVRRPSPAPIRGLLFSLFTAVLIFGAIALVYFIHMAAQFPEFTVGITGPFEAFVGIPTLGGMVYYFLFLVSAIAIFVLSGFGIAQTLRWQKRIRDLSAKGPVEVKTEKEEHPNE